MGPGLFYSWEMDRPVYIFLFFFEGKKEITSHLSHFTRLYSRTVPFSTAEDVINTPPNAFPTSPQPRGLKKFKYENV